MRLYELAVVLKTSLSEADRKKVLTTIKNMVKDLKVVKEEDWGQKPLAYMIKKEVAGAYHMMQFEGEAAVPADFETRLLRNDSILRHLLLMVK